MRSDEGGAIGSNTRRIEIELLKQGQETTAQDSKRLRCLYVSRYTPNRTPTDPYAGLPGYLTERTNLIGLWGTGKEKAPFHRHCEKVYEIDPSWWGMPPNFLFLWKLAKKIDGLDAVICGIDEYSLSLGLFAGRIAQVPVFCIVEDPPFTDRYLPPLTWRQRQERRIRRHVLRKLLLLCSGIFCFIEKDVLNELDLVGTPVYQFMNGVSAQAVEWGRKQTPKERKRAECLIGYVGIIDKGYGIEDLLYIFWEAAKASSEFRLRLIGPMGNDYRPYYEDKIRVLGLDSSVEVTGWLPYSKMLEKVEDCDICVYCNPPSGWFRTAQPLKVCEYLALGKPTVAWDYPGVRRLLDGGRLGILVPAGDESAFAQALIRLADPRERGSIENEIREAVQGGWSSDYWYSKVLDVLASVRRD